MFGYVKKILTHLKTKRLSERQPEPQNAAAPARLDASLDKNLAFFKELLGESSDFVVREFCFGRDGRLRGALLLIDGLVNNETVDLAVLRPLMYDADARTDKSNGLLPDLDGIGKGLLSAADVKTLSAVDEITGAFLSGNTVLLVDGFTQALSIGTRKWEKRGVEEPQTETVVRGPREGFTETLRVNTSLIRRKIKDPRLRLEALKIGEQTKTDVCLAYISDIANSDLIREVKKRLGEIKTDSILDSGYVEAYIEDAPYSIFSTVGNSERPDTVAGRLLEGRAAIIVDGSPFVLTVPMVFIESFQSAEDYYIRPYYATALRLMRTLCYFVTILAPAFYVAVTTFHQELIPTQLLFTMTAGLSGVPFPSMEEALLMLILFDILKEAGIRLPKAIGSAVSIVGALVIGESAVTAGLIGPFMVIVVSVTAIANFVVPAQSDSISLLRYFFLLLAGFLGGLGIITGMLFVLTYLVSLKSFGTHYLLPITPLSRQGMKDCFVRMPLWAMIKRPFSERNAVRRAPPDINARDGSEA